MAVRERQTAREDDAAEEPAPGQALSTSPEARAGGAGDRGAGRGAGRAGGSAGALRRRWRQLTSMRTALLLLLALAVAAVPGSVLPQRGLNQLLVDDYFAAHPRLAPVLDRLSLFDVYAAPWFAAVYLLLFVSLVGCLVPRIRLHARALASRPPAAPRHLDRLPLSASRTLEGTPEELAAEVAARLRRARWRTTVRAEPGDGPATAGVAVSAEKGYLRETGNLAFHLALVALLAGIATGGLWGWTSTVLVVEGDGFCSTEQAFDSYRPGRLVTGEQLPAFCAELDDFRATYLPDGQPDSFSARLRYGLGDAEPSVPTTIRVNEPLRLRGANVYLTNHGYAPILRYTDRYGTVFESPTPFLPEDVATLTSEGVLVLPEANQDPRRAPGAPPADGVQVAFEGIYMPTVEDDGMKVRSIFPAELQPGITLVAYRGDTGLDSGVPRSVYSLDRRQVEEGRLDEIGNRFLRPGETWRLDDGTSVTFVGTREWASVQVGHDPGGRVVLVASAVMVLGLLGSLTVRRRRVFVRLAPVPGSGDGAPRRTVVSAGGLARTDAGGFAPEFHRTVEQVTTSVERRAGPPAAAPDSSAARSARED